MDWTKIFSTKEDNWAALITRLTIGIVIFPHGAQKLFGWFGGYGFTGTMKYFTGMQHLPWIVGLAVILLESIGSIALILGVATRFFALGFIGEFIGIIFTVHIRYGFFMNWSGIPHRPEGYEYHLLVIGLALATLITGGGKWSVDSKLFKE